MDEQITTAAAESVDMWAALESETITMPENDAKDTGDTEADPDQEKPTADATDAQEKAPAADAKTDPVIETPKTDAEIEFELKHLGVVKKVKRDEAIALAQKGMDYDRIRGKYDEANTQMELLTELAADAGMSLKDYMDGVRREADERRIAAIAQADGITHEHARDRYEKLQLERATKLEKATKEKQMTAEQEAQAKRDKEVTDFLDEYPEYKAPDTKIPDDVLADWRSGKLLSAAYAKYENKLLKAEKAKIAAELEAEKKNAENKSRSVGPKSGPGESKVKDPYVSDWYS